MPCLVDLEGTDWTYGAEHELADWDCLNSLPNGFGRSPDYTIVNSNGIAAQPDICIYAVGGEINTPPTSSPMGQLECLNNLLQLYPDASVNYRSNLHLHIRVPGLKSSLLWLKKIQKYIHRELPKVLNLIEAIPRGETAAEKKRERRRRVSHHTLLSPKRLQHQLAANTVQEFFEREVPRTKAGRVMWHAQPRLAVGLRQILQTDTIEFRHFPGTLSLEELYCCIEWCRQFLLAAIQNRPILEIYNSEFKRAKFPKFPMFNYKLEVGYQATASHNGLSKEQISTNIDLILKGKFSGSAAEKEASERACGLSRKHLP